MRHALRLLFRNPGWTTASLLCLALGIGATTAIFSVVNAVVLRPLPYRNSEELVRVYSEFPTFPNGGLHRFWISPPEFVNLRKDQQSFTQLEAWQNSGANLAGAGAEPVRVVSAGLSGTLLSTLGVQPLLGRLLEAGDDKEGVPLVAVVSYGLWQGSFGGDPALVGKEILYNGSKCTVVGIMKPGFNFPPGDPQPPEIWIPLQLTSQDMNRWGNHRLYLMGRLKSGFSIEKGRQDLERLHTAYGLEGSNMVHRLNPKFHPLVAYPLLEETVGNVRPAMLMLMAATVLVLLIACGNVANLLLARAESRQREIAVRRAMGASASGLVRQFLLEGILLSGIGSIFGVAIGWGALRLILAAAGTAIPRASEVRLDGSVLLFSLACALFTGVVFGLAPLVQSLRGKPNDVLKAAGSRTTATREAHWMRQGLVVGEMALALVLLVGAGLLLDAFWRLAQVHSGVNPDGVLSMRIILPSQVYKSDAEVQHVWSEVRDRVSRIPGVESVSLLGGLMPLRPVNANDTYIEGLVPKPGGPIHNVDYWNAAVPGYFQMMGIPLVEGRYLEERDGAGAPRVLVVNETFASTFYGKGSAIGRRVKPGGSPDDPKDPWFTIVGVVKDVKNQGLDRPAGTELYFSLAQTGNNTRGATLLIKGKGDPWQWVSPARQAIRSIDAQLPLAQVRPLEEAISAARARPRFLALLLGLFAGLALGLAALGIFSVMSYTVAQRTNEFGVRMALGAGGLDVLRLVLKQAMVLVVAGMLAGAAGSLGLTRLLKGAVAGLGEMRPGAWAGAAVLLLIVTLAACLGPARRATRVDPSVALRYE